MKISAQNNIIFGWNIKTHIAVTELAVKNNNALSKIEKRMLGRFSQMPDLMKEELRDMNSGHFYDVLHEDPSFGIINDKKNNALYRFLEHTGKALKRENRENFLREIGYAVHYLQDATTPPHTEHGNYFHKFFRIPMHTSFEKGKKYGASSRLKQLTNDYTYEEIPFNSLKSLLHNTALFSVQSENQVNYLNKKSWYEIQSRCFNRSVNVSKAYLDYILQFIPPANLKQKL